ncbi:MAG TPA: FtsX-like permease family protein [Actinomycetes bacterium]|nr:FtsX-like permease family protein [Actinomycetes bacterium]
MSRVLPRWSNVVIAIRGAWHRGVLSLMLLGVAAAGSAAAAMGVGYGEAGDTAVLRDALRSAPPPARNVMLAAAWWPESKTPADVQRRREVELLEVTGGAGFFGPPIAGIDFEDRLRPGSGGEGRLHLAARDAVCDHLRLASGRCPQAAGEVLASAGAVEELDWQLADRIRLNTFGNLDRAGEFRPVPLRLVGIYLVPDRADPYWNGLANTYFPEQAGRRFAIEGTPPRYDALITPGSTFGLARPPEGESLGSSHVTLIVDLTAVRGDSADDLLGVVAGLRQQLADQRASGQPTFDGVRTDLDRVVDRAQVTQSAFSAPAVLVTLQVVALSWVLLFVVVTIVVEARAAEIGLARLRGLSTWGVHRFALGEPLVLIVASVPIGLVAGQLAAGLLAEQLGVDLSAEISALAVLAAAAAAMGGIVAAVIAARRAVTRALAEQWQPAAPRPRSRSWIPDAVLLAVAAAGFAELATGGLLGGDTRHSTLTLLAPGLLALAGAILAARTLPYLAGTLLPATRRHGGIGPFLAARRLARGTGTAATLIVLVTSLGLVTFATAAWSSARANHREVALTQLGADTVLTVSVPDTRTLTEAVQRVDPGGTRAAAVVTRRAGPADVSLVGVDPERFAQVGYWRADFDAQPLPELLTRLSDPGVVPSVVLTGDRIRVTVQLRAGSRGLHHQVIAQVQTPGGRTLRQVPIGELRQRGSPVLRTAPLPGCATGCELRGITVAAEAGNRVVSPVLTPSRVLLSKLEVYRGGAWHEIPAGLAESGAWRSPSVENSEATTLRTAPNGLFGEFLPTSNLVVIPNTYPDPMPALTTGGPQPDPFGPTVFGLDGVTLNVAPVARTRGLPGVTGAGVLVDERLAERAALGIDAQSRYEIWCVPGAAAEITAGLEAAGIPVTGQRRAAELAGQFGAQGPGLALRLLLAVAAAAAVLATGATAIDLYATSRRRTYELAALETVGASRRSLRTGLLLEHLAVLGTAAIVGPLAGLLAAWAVVSKVPTFSVSPVTPPLRYPLDLGAVAVAAAAALVLAAIAAAVMTEATARATRAERLREGPA